MAAELPLRLQDYQIILGTSSKYRRALFSQHFPSLSFTAKSPSIDERSVTLSSASDRSSANPVELTLAIAEAKADALTKEVESQHAILITSDQVLSYRESIREKPRDADECREYLRSYAQHPVVTVTSLVVQNCRTGKRFLATDIATQHFQSIPEEVIEKLIEKGDVMYCAGGVTVEDPLLEPFLAERVGSIESIMGLPVEKLRELLAQAVK